MDDVTTYADRADALYHDIAFRSVAEWKERTGCKAAAHLPVYAPRELVDAAGMLPVALHGAGDQVEIIRGDAFFQSYICQLPRSVVELAMSGRLDAMDAFLFPSTCDVIRNLSGMWKMLFPQKYTRYLDVPQNFDPKVGGRFWAAELRTLWRDLCALNGRTPSDDALRASIERFNDNRRAVHELGALRQAEPWRTPAAEAYLVIRAGDVMPVEEHTAFVRGYLAAALRADRPMRDYTRVVVTGAFCEQPPLELISTLERAGCYLVWDDLTVGARWIEGDIDAAGDPLEALAQAFLTKSVKNACLYEPDGKKGEWLTRTVQLTGADGVVFAAPSFCDPALLEQPMLVAALDRAGIPHTAFKYAENLGQFQVIREQAGTFSDSLRLWSNA